MARHSKTPASETSRATTGDPEHHAVKKTDGEHLQESFLPVPYYALSC